MKMIVRENVNHIAEPVKKAYSIYVDILEKPLRKSIGLVKGDIIVFTGNGTAVRLPVGTDGQVLTVDSTTETGLAWVDPS